MKILVTGGLGYLGCHAAVQMLKSDIEVVLLDNLSNSSLKVLDRIEQITGKKPIFYQGDISDSNLHDEIFTQNKIDCCIHFAGLKAVAESVKKPLAYYSNNITGTLKLLESMEKYKVKNIIFSSSATVYGNPKTVPIPESHPKGQCSNPYGWTKSMIEQILFDMYHADNSWNIVILRYFNPIGAHKSGLIGDNPKGIPNNIMPYITQVAVKKLEELNIFGNDYDTKDGTCIRDYIHVMDLIDGHISALSKINESCGLEIYNLGTGNGYSVVELVEWFSKVSGQSIPYKFAQRRAGDIASCYADNTKAINELNWKPKYDIYEMCRDAWNWQKNNPNGYE